MNPTLTNIGQQNVISGILSDINSMDGVTANDSSKDGNQT